MEFLGFFLFFRIFNAIIEIKSYLCGNINSEPIIPIQSSLFSSMKLSQDKKRKYQIVTLLFSLLLGVGVAAFYKHVIKLVDYDNAIGMIIFSLIPAVIAWLSIRLAFAQWKDSHWILLTMKMVLYFCGMMTVLFLMMMLISSKFYQDIETYPLVMVHILWFAGVTLLAIVLMIPFGFLSHWLSRLSSTESQENQLKEK